MNRQITDNQFMELIDQHRGLIWKICLFYASTEADRQDLFQDIIFQTWKSYPGFRNESRFSTWLYKICLHTALFARRKQKRDMQALPAEWGDTACRQAEYETTELLHKAIQALNEIEKSLVLLFLDGYPYEEMEKITGISNGTIRVKMSRIKQKLKMLVK